MHSYPSHWILDYKDIFNHIPITIYYQGFKDASPCLALSFPTSKKQEKLVLDICKAAFFKRSTTS